MGIPEKQSTWLGMIVYFTGGSVGWCMRCYLLFPTSVWDMLPRTMVKNAIAWAKNNGYCRVNAVHGAEEFRVKTFEKFNLKDLERTRHTASAEVELEDLFKLTLVVSFCMCDAICLP